MRAITSNREHTMKNAIGSPIVQAEIAIFETQKAGQSSAKQEWTIAAAQRVNHGDPAVARPGCSLESTRKEDWQFRMDANEVCPEWTNQGQGKRDPNSTSH